MTVQEAFRIRSQNRLTARKVEKPSNSAGESKRHLVAALFICCFALLSASPVAADATAGENGRHEAAPAVEKLLPRARAGDPRAQFLIGRYYLNRWLQYGAAQKQSAAEWLEMAVAQGYTPAMPALALLLKHGSASAADEARAMTLLRTAAEAGNVEGQYALGFTLANMLPPGDATSREGVRWLQKAAAQKKWPALGNLATYYFHYWQRVSGGGSPALERELVIETKRWLLLDVLLSDDPSDYLITVLPTTHDDPAANVEVVHRARTWLRDNGFPNVSVPDRLPWKK